MTTVQNYQRLFDQELHGLVHDTDIPYEEMEDAILELMEEYQELPITDEEAEELYNYCDSRTSHYYSILFHDWDDYYEVERPDYMTCILDGEIRIEFLGGLQYRVTFMHSEPQIESEYDVLAYFEDICLENEEEEEEV